MTVKVMRATKRTAPNSPAKPDKTLAKPMRPGPAGYLNREEADAIICHAIRTVNAAALLMYKSKGADLLTMKCETAAQDLASLRRYLSQALGD